MKFNLLGALLVTVWFIIAVPGITYYWYLAWFKPLKFKGDRVKKVRDWWPFANFYRSYLNSGEMLWTVRITTSFALLVFIVLFCITILGLLGIFH